MTGMQQVENEVEAGMRAALNVPAVLALATQGVWNGAADEGTACPWVVFQQIPDALHAYTFGDRRVLTDYQFIVKGVTEGMATLLAGQIDRAIDTALSASTLTVAGYAVNLCRRVSDVDYHEVDKGRSFRHRGGRYAIQITN